MSNLLAKLPQKLKNGFPVYIGKSALLLGLLYGGRLHPTSQQWLTALFNIQNIIFLENKQNPFSFLGQIEERPLSIIFKQKYFGTAPLIFLLLHCCYKRQG
jgi:hypothetical protein